MSKIVIEKTGESAESSELILDFELDTARSYTIGRHPSNDVQIDHASISRIHALIFHHSQKWMIADLDSTKGLSLNGERIRCATFSDEMCVTMGPARLWFAQGPEHTSAPPRGTRSHVDVLQLETLSKDRSTSRKQAFCLAGFRNVSVGSDSQCDVRLENSEVRPLHAIVFRRNDQWFVTSTDNSIIESRGTDGHAGATFMELGDDRFGTCGSLVFSLIRAMPIT